MKRIGVVLLLCVIFVGCSFLESKSFYKDTFFPPTTNPNNFLQNDSSYFFLANTFTHDIVNTLNYSSQTYQVNGTFPKHKYIYTETADGYSMTLEFFKKMSDVSPERVCKYVFSRKQGVLQDDKTDFELSAKLVSKLSPRTFVIQNNTSETVTLQLDDTYTKSLIVSPNEKISIEVFVSTLKITKDSVTKEFNLNKSDNYIIS